MFLRQWGSDETESVLWFLVSGLQDYDRWIETSNILKVQVSQSLNVKQTADVRLALSFCTNLKETNLLHKCLSADAINVQKT